MIHRTLLTAVLLLISFSLVQAQQRLPRPQNIRVENDAAVWDSVANASGYRVEWVRAAGRLRFITEEVLHNRFSMSEFHYGENYYVKVQAVTDAKAEYQDSRWTGFYVLVRPWPTRTPTNTPTATPTPTSTRAVLRGLRTPKLSLLSSTTLAWDAVAGAVGYELYLSGDGASQRVQVDAPQTEYSFSNLLTGVTYVVLARALGDGRIYESQGRWSQFVRIRLPSVDTDTPTVSHTATVTPTATNIATNTPTVTHTATNTVTDRPTATNTPTATDTATTTPATLRKLPAPEFFRALSGNTVAWDAVEGASRYRVRLDPPNANRILKRVDPPQTQYTFENLVAGVVYRVRVRAMGDEIT